MSLFSLSRAGGAAVTPIQSPQHLLHTHSLPSPQGSMIGKTGMAPALLCMQVKKREKPFPDKCNKHLIGATSLPFLTHTGSRLAM